MNTGIIDMSRYYRMTMLSILVMAALIFMVPNVALSADDKAEAQAIVDKAKGALVDLLNDENFYWLQKYIDKAQGIIIFPQVLKAGYVIGGSGGTGVFLVKNKGTETWGNPVFYTLASITFGLQIGAESASVVMLAMNAKSVESLLSSSLKLGGDASVAVGPIGAGAKGAATIPEVTADFLSFSKAKGLYAGMNLEGAVLAVRDSLDESYYGKPVSPRDLVFGMKADASPGANALRMELEKASKK